MRRLQWVILDLNSNKGSLVDGLPDFQVPAYDDDHLHVKTFHLKKASENLLRAFHLSTEEMKRRRFRGWVPSLGIGDASKNSPNLLEMVDMTRTRTGLLGPLWNILL